MEVSSSAKELLYFVSESYFRAIRNRNRNVQLTELEHVFENVFLQGHLNCMILSIGEGFQMLQTLHFRGQSIFTLLRGDPATYTADLVIDMVKELCNWSMGYAKNELRLAKINLTCGLPVCSRSFDSIFVSKKRNTFYGNWLFDDRVSRSYLVGEIEILDEKRFLESKERMVHSTQRIHEEDKTIGTGIEIL